MAIDYSIESITSVATQGPFQPNWNSLKSYRIPQWYEDAKFGIFVHWGVYSVPAFESEWYPRNMYVQGHDCFKHHVATYGSQDIFGYKDFIPQFKCEKFVPDDWVQLFVESGARFVMPVAEHHDGFALYDTVLSNWNSVQMGPKRDIIGELAQAILNRDLIFATSSHRAEHWWYFGGGRQFNSDVNDPAHDSLYGPARTEEDVPDEAFLTDWLSRTCELVDLYRPRIVWFDWWIDKPAFKPYLQLFASYYYNRAVEWGEEVAINYKNDAYEIGTAVFDVERGQLSGIRPRLWQNDTAVGKNSWGFVHNMNYKKSSELIRDLVDIVSKNGTLLLNVGPRPDGTIPDDDQRILREIGQWLSANGEAIYGTRPWHIYGEGPTEIPEGGVTDTKRSPFTSQDIRFTTKGNRLFAFILEVPNETVTIKSLATNAPRAVKVESVRIVETGAYVNFSQTATGLQIGMPANMPESASIAFELISRSHSN